MGFIEIIKQGRDMAGYVVDHVRRGETGLS